MDPAVTLIPMAGWRAVPANSEVVLHDAYAEEAMKVGTDTCTQPQSERDKTVAGNGSARDSYAGYRLL